MIESYEYVQKERDRGYKKRHREREIEDGMIGEEEGRVRRHGVFE